MSTAFGEGGGGVAAMDERDAQYVRKALNAKPDKVTKAGLFPPSELLAAFARETKIPSSMPITAVVDAFVNACQIDAALRFSWSCGAQEGRDAARRAPAAGRHGHVLRRALQ